MCQGLRWHPVAKRHLLVAFHVAYGLTHPDTLWHVLYHLMPLLLQEWRYLDRLLLADVRKPTRGEHLRAAQRPMRRRPHCDTVLSIRGLLLDLFYALP